jgi:hypothetical protein
VASEDSRRAYFEEVAATAKAVHAVADPSYATMSRLDAATRPPFMPGMFDPLAYSRVLETEHTLYCDNMVVELGIAKNKALRENIFVVVVSLCNRIPVFVVGRPGTSKSLTIRLISDNLRGPQSENAFWKRFPTVHVMPYQCSPHSTSDSILFQYDKVCCNDPSLATTATSCDGSQPTRAFGHKEHRTCCHVLP